MSLIVAGCTHDCPLYICSAGMQAVNNASSIRSVTASRCIVGIVGYVWLSMGLSAWELFSAQYPYTFDALVLVIVCLAVKVAHGWLMH